MHKINLADIRSATHETVRDINRRIILNLIRSRQPTSRAELARLSGLQRSTVSLIVDGLLADAWVREGSSGRTVRGRRPTLLRLNQNRMILGMDLRPTTTRLGVADLYAHFVVQEVFPTGEDPEAFLKESIRRIRRLLDLYPADSWEGIGVSLPGRADPISHRLVFAPNLKWKEVDLKTPLEQATGLPVQLENAANACVLSEVWFGKDSDTVQDLLVVTVSEGIGVGIFANGQLITGAGGFAGEFGHTTLDPNGPTCRCGKLGCWEVFASNTAALRYYDGGSSSMAEDFTFGDLVSLANQGNPQAVQAVKGMTRHLAAGLANLAIGLSPGKIVVVGEITRLWSLVGPMIEQAISDRSYAHSRLPELLPANEADQPRLRGTIALVIQKHFTASTGFRSYREGKESPSPPQ